MSATTLVWPLSRERNPRGAMTPLAIPSAAVPRWYRLILFAGPWALGISGAILIVTSFFAHQRVPLAGVYVTPGAALMVAAVFPRRAKGRIAAVIASPSGTLARRRHRQATLSLAVAFGSFGVCAAPRRLGELVHRSFELCVRSIVALTSCLGARLFHSYL